MLKISLLLIYNACSYYYFSFLSIKLKHNNDKQELIESERNNKLTNVAWLARKLRGKKKSQKYIAFRSY